jgi:RNA polymerase sigma-70 factor (ECF subfamily)
MAVRFEAHRARLRALAGRMLGGDAEADDAVQEAWLRLTRAGGDDGIDELGAWLTTVVSRICLNMLRARDRAPVVDPPPAPPSPEEVVALADALGPALLVVLDSLRPAERVALVLHDVFGLTFEEVAGVLGRSPVAVRQLASRARRRVQGLDVDDHSTAATSSRRRQVVDAFMAASARGDVAALIEVLDPDVRLDPDAATIRRGAMVPTVGAAAVAEVWKGRASVAVAALVDGQPGAAYAPKRRAVGIFAFHFDDAGERIVAIEAITDPEVVRLTDVVLA